MPLPASVGTSGRECPWREPRIPGSLWLLLPGPEREGRLQGWARTVGSHNSVHERGALSLILHECGSPRITSTPNHPHPLSPLLCLDLIKHMNLCRALATHFRMAKMRIEIALSHFSNSKKVEPHYRLGASLYSFESARPSKITPK